MAAQAINLLRKEFEDSILEVGVKKLLEASNENYIRFLEDKINEGHQNNQSLYKEL